MRFFPTSPHKVTASLGRGWFTTSGFKSAVLTLLQNHYKISAKRFWTDASGAILGPYSVYTTEYSLGYFFQCVGEGAITLEGVV